MVCNKIKLTISILKIRSAFLVNASLPLLPVPVKYRGKEQSHTRVLTNKSLVRSCGPMRNTMIVVEIPIWPETSFNQFRVSAYKKCNFRL